MLWNLKMSVRVTHVCAHNIFSKNRKNKATRRKEEKEERGEHGVHGEQDE